MNVLNINKILKLLIALCISIALTGCFPKSSGNKSHDQDDAENGLSGSFNIDGRLINVDGYYYSYKEDKGFYLHEDKNDADGEILIKEKNEDGYLFNYDAYLFNKQIYYSYIEAINNESIVHIYKMDMNGEDNKEIIQFQRDYDYGGYISFIYKQLMVFSTYNDLGEIPSFINLRNMSVQHAQNGYFFEGDIPIHHDYYENDLYSPHHYNQFFICIGANGEASTTKAYLFDADELQFHRLTDSVWDVYLRKQTVYTIEEVDSMYSIYAYDLSTLKEKDLKDDDNTVKPSKKELTQFDGNYGAGFYKIENDKISYEIYSDIGDSNFYEYSISNNHKKSIVVEEDDDEEEEEDEDEEEEEDDEDSDF